MRTATMLKVRSHQNVTNDSAPLLRDLRRALWESGYREIQQVKIEIHRHEVLLRGNVSSYFQKQLAQEIIKRIPGVAGLQNEIRVVPKAKG